jgi:hypothetical protein
MKTKYIISIAILILIFITLAVWFWYGIGCDPRIGNIIQVAGVFVALITSFLALSTADPKSNRVNFAIEQSLEKKEAIEKSNMSEDLKKNYSGFPDPVSSYRVQFKITNKTGFTLRKPTFSFRVPMDKKHPNKKEADVKYSMRSFNSNLYNSSQELRMIEFADTCLISNSIPYFNNNEYVTLWIRMVLHENIEPFPVEVSINCENAEGITKKVEIQPKRLISNDL